jgi:multimeric flavodoxin WrbA
MEQIENRALLVSGSPRAGGNTDLLLREVARGLGEEGFPTLSVALRDYRISPCVACEQCRRDATCSRIMDGMHLLYPEIERARCLVLGSPTYNYNVTPEIKSFIDRLYPYFDFGQERPGPYRCRLADSGRCAGLIGVCEQHEASELGYTLPFMRDALRVIGYETAEELPITGHFARGSVKNDQEALKTAFEAGLRLGRRLCEGDDRSK